MLKTLTLELRKSNNLLLSKLFPFSTSRLLGQISTQELDSLYYKLLKQLNVDFLIECGAHEATASLNFVKNGGNSLAIEANPFVFKNITPKSFDNYVSVNFALSNKKDKVDFYFPIDNNNSGQSTFSPKKGIKYDKIEVNTIELDELIKQKGIENQNFAFWIDVEGHQKEVFEGSMGSLQNCRLIKIEVEDVELFTDQKWLVHSVNEFLEKNDFVPVFRDFEYVGQFNIIYVKKIFLEEIITLVDSSKENLKKQIGLKKIILFLTKKQNFLSEIKSIVINLFGAKIGNFLAKSFGSKSSSNFFKN